MATETFPSDYLRGPLNANFSRDIATGFLQSSPQSGTPYNIRRSFDNPVTFNIDFALEGGKKTLFNQWVYDKLGGGIKPFNIDLDTEGGIATQEAWFTPDGVPQLTSTSAGIYFYSATIRLRKLVNPWDGEYDTLEYLAENSACNDPFAGGASLLDIAINEDWPEA